MTTNNPEEVLETIEAFLVGVEEAQRAGKDIKVYKFKESPEKQYITNVTWWPYGDKKPPALSVGHRYSVTFKKTPAKDRGFHRDFVSAVPIGLGPVIKEVAPAKAPTSAQDAPKSEIHAQTPYDLAEAQRQRSIRASVALQQAVSFVGPKSLDRTSEMVVEVADAFFAWIDGKAATAPAVAETAAEAFGKLPPAQDADREAAIARINASAAALWGPKERVNGVLALTKGKKREEMSASELVVLAAEMERLVKTSAKG